MTKLIEKAKVDRKEHGKLSIPFLQRKYKLSFEGAKELINGLYDKKCKVFQDL